MKKVISAESSEEEGEEYFQGEGTARAKARVHSAPGLFPDGDETHQEEWQEQRERGRRWAQRCGASIAAHGVTSILRLLPGSSLFL